MAGDRMPWWTSDRVIDIAGIALAAAPWAFPGPSLAVRGIAAACCIAWWVFMRMRSSSFEMPLAIIPLSLIVRMVLGFV